MSDTYIEPAGDELSAVGEYEQPESDWSGPSQDEWEQLREGLGYVAGAVQQAEAAGRAEAEQARREELEDLMFENPEAYVRAMLEERFSEQIAPIQQWVEQRQNADALADAHDQADDILLEAGVPETELDAVHDTANELFEPMVMQYAEQYQHLYRDVLAKHGPEAAAQWVDDARRQIAVTALQQAAAATQIGQETTGGDEMSLVQKYSRLLGMSRGAAPQQRGVSRPGGDEMSVVARYAGRAR